MMFSLAFFGGTLGLLVLPQLPSAWVVLAVLALTLTSLVVRRWLPFALALGSLGVGFLYTAAHAHTYLQQRWPTSRAEDRVIAQVIIDTVPAARDGAWLFDGEATLEAPDLRAQPLRVRLIWRDTEDRPHAGERWRLLLSLRPPRARVNPGTMDVERMLFHDRVHALGSVVDSSINRRIDAGHRPLAALRESIALHIDDRVADREAAALIAALAVGVTGDMSREQWRIFNVTGTTHLVAISGLHVTLFAVISIAVARWLWSVALWRVVRVPRDTFAALVGFAAAAAYATLAGLSVPTQRTLVMLGVWLLTRSLARACSPFHSYALALCAVLVLDPFAPLAPGFWLSFGAMGAIVLVTSPRFVLRSALSEAIVVQAAVTVALAPLTLAAFGSISLISPLVNAVAIPAMSWVFVPTILLSIVLAPVMPDAGDAVLALAAWMHHAGWPWLAAAADMSWSLIHCSPPWWWYIAGGFGALASLLPLPRSLRVAALVWLVPLAFAGSDAPTRGSAEITVLDVGEGTAVVVQTAHHVLVYDTGDVYGTNGRTAEAVLVPFLRSQGRSAIDLLVLSDRKSSGSPGVTAVFAELPVRQTLVAPGAPADFDGARTCKTESWTWDEVLFQAAPTDVSVSGVGEPSFCVLGVATRTGRALLPGEIDARTERRLVSSSGVGLLADVVVVPRHGSDSASTLEFIGAVNARWAVVSGRRSRDDRTKPAVARWEKRGAAVVATADLGAITVELGPGPDLEPPLGQRLARPRL
jgi:competence protein ComEC